MQNTQANGIFHHDWFVEVVVYGNSFGFRCYHPHLEEFSHDGLSYHSYQSAIQAGCQFIDREVALTCLLNLLEELVRDHKISPEEYWNLANFEQP